MKIKISKDRSVFPYRTNVSNQYENKTDSIEFDLDVPNGNKYLFVEIDGKTVPYPLLNPFPITSDLSWTAGGHRACVVVSNVEIKDTINKEDTLFISDEFMLVVAKNFINPADVSQGTLPEPLKIVYDDLMSLKKELENKLSNGDFNGDSAYEVAVKNGYKGTEKEWIASLKGEKGDKGDPYSHSAEFQQLAQQVERKATEAENAAQSALESKTSALQGATSALEASESAKQSAISASESAQSAKDGASSALQSANSAKESAKSASQSAQSASQGAVSAEQAKGYAEQAKTAETNAKLSETNSKASEMKAKEYLNKIAQSDNKMIGTTDISEEPCVSDSFEDFMKINVYATKETQLANFKVTGRNILNPSYKYEEYVPYSVKQGTIVTIIAKDGFVSPGGSIKFKNADGTDRWLGYTKGHKKTTIKLNKDVQGFYCLLSNADTNYGNYCLASGDIDEYEPYNEQTIALSNPITLRGKEVAENYNVTISEKKYISDILKEKDGVIGIERNLSATNEPQMTVFEPMQEQDQAKIKGLKSFMPSTILRCGAPCKFEYTQAVNVVKNNLISRILYLESKIGG